jgi:hypothetical protein
MATVGRALHEAQVELDDVGRQEGHHRQRARVGPDVVKRDGAAQRALELDSPQQLGGLAGQRALGDLQDHLEVALGGRVERAEVVGPVAPGVGLDVHEQAQGSAQAAAQRGPERRRLAGPVELGDAPGLARGGEHRVRPLQRRALRAAGQRLVADDRARAQADDGLEQRAQRAHVDRQGRPVDGRLHSGRRSLRIAQHGP